MILVNSSPNNSFDPTPSLDSTLDSQTVTSSTERSLVHDSPQLLRRDDFLLKRAEIEANIDELRVIGGFNNPWLSNAYLELGTLLIGEASYLDNSPGLLQEAEGFLLQAYEVATATGDTQKRIESLKELALVASITDDSQLSVVLSNQAEALKALDNQLNDIPKDQRLRYEHPSVPTQMNDRELRAFKAGLREVLQEVAPSDLSEHESAGIASYISSQLLEAASNGRWIDDFLMLEISEGLNRKFHLGDSIHDTAQMVKHTLPKATEYIDLGLHERTLMNLSR